MADFDDAVGNLYYIYQYGRMMVFQVVAPSCESGLTRSATGIGHAIAEHSRWSWILVMAL